MHAYSTQVPNFLLVLQCIGSLKFSFLYLLSVASCPLLALINPVTVCPCVSAPSAGLAAGAPGWHRAGRLAPEDANALPSAVTLSAPPSLLLCTHL